MHLSSQNLLSAKKHSLPRELNCYNPLSVPVFSLRQYHTHRQTIVEESIAIISKLAEKYGLETEVIYQYEPCPVVDFKGEAFKLVEEVAADIYPGVGICPYVMTGGTDAKYYSAVSDNCIRFAPLYIDAQQYASIHGLNENIHRGALPGGVDFYKEIIRRS